MNELDVFELPVHPAVDVFPHVGRGAHPGASAAGERMEASLLRVDPAFQALIPPLTPDELAQLRANIEREGCRYPLVTWNGVVLDGHNRLAICTELEIPYATNAIDGLETRDEAKLWIIHNQLGRRNITDFQRCELSLAAEPLIAAQAKVRQISSLKKGKKGFRDSFSAHNCAQPRGWLEWLRRFVMAMTGQMSAPNLARRGRPNSALIN